MPSGAPRPLSAAQASALQRAFGLLRSGHPDEALAIAGPLAAEATQAPDAHQLLAMCLAQCGRTQEADDAFRRALELAPGHPLILSNHAAMLRRAGRPAAALPIAEHAVRSSPSSAKAWTDLATTAHAAGAGERAIAAAKRALSMQPDSATAWEVLGKAAREGEDLAVADEAFRKAVELAPGSVPARLGLASVQRMSGRADLAVASLEEAERQCGVRPDLADALAGALLDAGRTDDAIALAERVARDHPDHVPALVTLAKLRWEYAPECGADPAAGLRAAVSKRPHNDALRAAFARFLLDVRAAEEALVHLGRLRAQSDRPWLALMEAQALDMLGRGQAARAVHEGLQRSGAGASPTYANAYARHLLESGEPAAASRTAAAATGVDPRNQEAWAYQAIAWRLLEDPREFWLCDYERLVALVEIEPPPSFAGQDAFLEALASTLQPMHRAHRAPVQQSLRAGSQTPGRLFGRPDPVLDAARRALLSGIERWLATLSADPAHPFLGRKRDGVRIGGSWSVRLQSSGHHVNHIHEEGWMSSAFYVSLPPSVGAAGTAPAGAIQFGQPPVEMRLGLAPRRVIVPRPGMLALFPSYMWHGTIPFDDDAPRTTIAFDMLPLEGEP